MKTTEQGSATIIMIAVIGVVMILFGTAITVARINLAKQSAQTVSDLSALAGAEALHNQNAPPCEVAQQVVSRNGGAHTDLAATCTVDSKETVTVCVHLTLGVFPIQACGVAGPDPALQ